MEKHVENTRCPDCEQWQEMIDNANKKLARLRQPPGLLGIQDSVGYSFSKVDELLANPESYEKKRASEEQLQRDIKVLVLVLLGHQRKGHSPVAQESAEIH